MDTVLKSVNKQHIQLDNYKGKWLLKHFYAISKAPGDPVRVNVI